MHKKFTNTNTRMQASWYIDMIENIYWRSVYHCFGPSTWPVTWPWSGWQDQFCASTAGNMQCLTWTLFAAQGHSYLFSMFRVREQYVCTAWCYGLLSSGSRASKFSVPSSFPTLSAGEASLQTVSGMVRCQVAHIHKNLNKKILGVTYSSLAEKNGSVRLQYMWI